MKKTIISLIAVIITTTTCAMDHDIDAQQWCRKVTMGWNLGNALESAGAGWNYEKYAWENIWSKDYNEWETAWSNPKTTREMLKKVKAEGFNIEARDINSFATVSTIMFERKFESPTQYLLPIPLSDVNKNLNLVQNPGY